MPLAEESDEGELQYCMLVLTELHFFQVLVHVTVIDELAETFNALHLTSSYTP